MDGFTLLREKVLSKLKPEFVQPLTFEMWEDRILPLLAEIEAAGGLPKKFFVFEGRPVLLAGNDAGADEFLEQAGRNAPAAPEPEAVLYALSGLTNLSILRRFKEYPDETGRDQLEEPWAGECPEARALVLLNSRWM